MKYVIGKLLLTILIINLIWISRCNSVTDNPNDNSESDDDDDSPDSGDTASDNGSDDSDGDADTDSDSDQDSDEDAGCKEAGEPTWEDPISPIFQASCGSSAVPGCHGEDDPLDNYDRVQIWIESGDLEHTVRGGHYEQIAPDPITQEGVKIVLHWLDIGAPESDCDVIGEYEIITAIKEGIRKLSSWAWVATGAIRLS